MFRTLFLAVFVASANVAVADGFNYDFFDLGYGFVELDDADVDGDGIGFDGSLAIHENFHLFADYQTADFDFGIDATNWSAGVGYNTPLSDTLDVLARLSYEYAEVEASGFGSADDSGLGLGVGLRFMATPALELNGGIDYVDLDDSGNDTAITAAALYNFNEMFSAGLSTAWSDDASTYLFGGRFYFGR